MVTIQESTAQAMRREAGESGRREGSTRDRGPARTVPALDETAKAHLYRQARRGVFLEALAQQSGLSRAPLTRGMNEMRGRRLLENKLGYMGDPAFEDPAVVAEILGPFPPAAGSGSDARRSRVPEDLPPYLESLYEIPLLSREQERYLFRRMNYLKYQAHQLRERLDPARCKAADL